MNVSSPWLHSYLRGEISEPLVISTTGTGGAVKNIEISAPALIASANAAHKFLGAHKGDSWSLLLPTNHIAGINVLARSILLESELKKIEEKSDFTSIVPTQLYKALNGDNLLLEHLKRCKAVLVGGARLPDTLREDAVTAGINIIATYGATETCGGCVYNGIPLEGVEIQINGGIIELKVPEMNQGNWIRTNDLGEIKDGKLIVQGRADDVIISGGENVSLTLLETFLETKFPNQNFLAVGINDEKWGQSIGLLSNKELPENLSELISRELGKPYLPKTIRVMAELPTIGIGKYDRTAAARLL